MNRQFQFTKSSQRLFQRQVAHLAERESVKPDSRGVVPQSRAVARGARNFADQVVELLTIGDAHTGRLVDGGEQALVLEFGTSAFRFRR